MSLGAGLEEVHAHIHEIGPTAPKARTETNQCLTKKERERERERETHTLEKPQRAVEPYEPWNLLANLVTFLHQNRQAENSLRLVQDDGGVALRCQTLREKAKEYEDVRIP